MVVGDPDRGIDRKALEDFILNPDIDSLRLDPDPPILSWDNIPLSYDRVPCYESTTIEAERDIDTGVIIGFKEVDNLSLAYDGRTSMSLQRAPAPPEESMMGSVMNYPFWPGGFDAPLEIDLKENLTIDFEENLLTCAPGLPHGIEFPKYHSKEKSVIPSSSELDIHAVPSGNITVDLLALTQEEINLNIWKPDTDSKKPEAVKTTTKSKESEEIESLMSNFTEDVPVLNISSSADFSLKVKSLLWAEEIDISQPVTDFEKLIPEPAHVYPFVLDTFQKQAILKLEEHNHVFVAAHTSAGKTVVAEYAIALSRKHMTRAIYTSPIKALSNQKYRDFTNTFSDVGLITGDIQINSTASCLIMTTEILKSMLYGGSDITRDLEYVIFDEVHYINDTDRGHVWEEVLILLPQHVCIVMLSATVPNTLEFANWVGMTKRSKVYVISTAKRPVPLQHYLYTGFGGKSRDDRFLVVDAEGRWQDHAYKAAQFSKKSRQTDFRKEFGHGKLNPKQEQTMWVGLIDHLRRHNELPVIAFTLSRKRCDLNAQSLNSIDFTTQREKNQIHRFFSRCLKRLNAPDRNLPQVISMQNLLQRGIGVHHSGILPILKEIVEMCFQQELVKLLFATETFAMGVNMPARTVIFDSCTKYDGVGVRMLMPAEYIQMAGRAGRRGLDSTGTVIVLCKTDVPACNDVKEMMLGRPMLLQSQFRLTYAMILNLLRVQDVTVENMMCHSFREFGHMSKAEAFKKQLIETESQISSMEQLSEHLSTLNEFYKTAVPFIDAHEFVMSVLLHQKCNARFLTPCKVFIISQGVFYNRLAMVLEVRRDFKFTALVLADSDTFKDQFVPASVQDSTSKSHSLYAMELWQKLVNLSDKHRFFVPQNNLFHSVITVEPKHVMAVTNRSIRLDPGLILKDWNQRQMSRFRDAPVGVTFNKALQELLRLTNEMENSTQIYCENLRQDIDITTNLGFLKELEKFDQLRKDLTDKQKCTRIANFEKQFAQVFDRMLLEDRRDKLSFSLSHESMSLYPDYKNKLDVLRTMKYIDEHNKVLLKGRVACEMGNNELIITEIIFRNVLKDLSPAEIAALLSSLVFQARCTEPEIPKNFVKCIQDLNLIDMEIAQIERTFDVGQDSTSVSRLNFGLITVVHEWAQKKPFSDIMRLTDVQEGIIVRCIQQLNETIRDAKSAARIIGDPVLGQKMDDASEAIQRDIVFAASLYTQDDYSNVKIVTNEEDDDFETTM